ncbi:MAG: O-antigen polymerase [Bryobacterales bacterium]|nr:O-antigen polymerase [Bryobacterales bacterium]
MGNDDRKAVLVGGCAAAAAYAGVQAPALAIAFAPLSLFLGSHLLTRPDAWLTLFFCVAVLCPPLPFALGNSGPHPAAAVALLGVLIGLSRLREWRFRANMLTCAFMLLNAAILCSVGLGAVYSGATIAAGSLARVILFAIAGYIFFYTVAGPAVSKPFARVRILFFAAALAALFACVDFYFQFPAPAGFGPQFVWLDTGVFRRAQGLFYEASTLGNFCVFFLVMIAVSLFRPSAQRPVRVLWMAVGGVVLAGALVLSYSRASVVNLTVALATLWMIRRKGGTSWRPAVGILCCAILATLVCYALVPELFRAYLLRLQNSAIYSFSSTNGVLSGRLDNWDTIARFLIDHPWHLLAGVGYKTLPYSDFVGAPVIADNMYLSTLAETGLAGLAALLFFLFAVLRTSYRASRDADPQRSFFGAWTFCFWCGEAVQMLSGDLLTYWRVLPIYFWILALAAR